MSKDDQNSSRAARNLSILIAVYFLVEALCQPDGLIYQSLASYLGEVLGWPSDWVTDFYSLMAVPLLARPLYGVLCDCVPLFGYRRKTWLAAFMLLNTIGFGSLAIVSSPILVCTALYVASVGVAAGSTLASAVIVESGNKHKNTGSLINQQWFWYNAGALAFAQAGGILAAHLSAKMGFHVAAVLVAGAPLFVMWASMRLYDEPRIEGGVNFKLLKQHAREVKDVLKTTSVWSAAAFIAVYNLSPLMSFNAVQLVDHLREMQYSETFIGLLLALGAVGAIVASFVYKHLEKRMTIKQLLLAGVYLTIISRISYVFIGSEVVNICIWFFNGMFSMLILIPCLRLAAARCPPGLEAFAYGLMTCSLTGSRILASTGGGWLFEHVFNHNLTLLCLLSAALAMVALPFAKRLKEDEPMS
jgi:hypothetical protein